MPRNRGALYKGVSERLGNVRHQLNYSPQEMARVLGIKAHGYYKNESGDTFPGVSTLDRLQKNFDISMDWLLFNKGPMFFKEKQSPGQPTFDIVSQEQELGELVKAIGQDPQLKHEILACFYQYKSKKKQTE